MRHPQSRAMQALYSTKSLGGKKFNKTDLRKQHATIVIVKVCNQSPPTASAMPRGSGHLSLLSVYKCSVCGVFYVIHASQMQWMCSVQCNMHSMHANAEYHNMLCSIWCIAGSSETKERYNVTKIVAVSPLSNDTSCQEWTPHPGKQHAWIPWILQNWSVVSMILEPDLVLKSSGNWTRKHPHARLDSLEINMPKLETRLWLAPFGAFLFLKRSLLLFTITGQDELQT